MMLSLIATRKHRDDAPIIGEMHLKQFRRLTEIAASAVALSRQHPVHDAVTVDENMNQGRYDVQTDHHQQ
jgi:hypothetical protein